MAESIPQQARKGKFWAVIAGTAILGGIAMLFALGAGILYERAKNRGKVAVYKEIRPELAVTPTSTTEIKGESVVASKTGKKYHFPWCSGAKRIASSSKIVFVNAEEAKKAGYEPAGNCKGLK